MCTLVILRRPEAKWPLILAANRDELRSRPWRPPARHWQDRPDVVAGMPAQGRNGDVYYCGENAKDYEYTKGDKPQIAELIAIDGSFKHGVDGAKTGILMLASPQVGDIYRQEFLLGDAEDGAEVMSTSYRYGDDASLDKRVPQELADLFCAGDCLVTRDFNLIEPGPSELKYYAPGVGLFLEVGGKEVIRLVSCNVDPRCDEL